MYLTSARSMEQLLSHIERMTGERERSQLNIAFAQALRDVLGKGTVSVLKFLQTPAEAFVWPAAVVDDSGTHLHDDGLSVPPRMVSVDYYPRLAACLRTGTKQLNGEATVFPIMRSNGSICGFVTIEGISLDETQLTIAEHLLTIFTNMLSLLDYSEIDTLTGLLNRKTFDRYLIRILYSLAAGDDRGIASFRLPRRRQARTTRLDHWLAVIDVDHFKPVNDNFGHLIGDEMLLLLATLMKASFRIHDQLFRFGGEEFVVLLKPTEEQNAHATFERFREKVAAFDFPQAGRLTVSIGFVRVGREDQPSVVLERADAALYWAKAHGRNRVTQFDETVAADTPVAKAGYAEVEYF